jgi:isopentenyl-diphosphate Delta-isomerase
MDQEISGRKADHLELCATGDVGFRAKTTLLEHVEFVHDALPEMSLEEVDTSVTLLDKRLKVPLIVASMTGGTERAREINRELARIAEERGYGFGLGSQRAMLNGDQSASYEVRDVAPETLVLGNIGGVQARTLATDAVEELCKGVGADALCVHLNPAMEIVQPEGDRHFGGVLAAIERLVEELPIPVVAKETGCGMSPSTCKRLARVGVRHVDVSGAGGTSWVAVETQRASGANRPLGEALRDWGIPTAASVVFARATRPRFKSVIATGGVSTGLDVARALALGAHAAGIARPVLQAFTSGGRDGALRLFDQIEAELRATMLLIGARDIPGLRKAPMLVGAPLRSWTRLARKGRATRVA